MSTFDGADGAALGREAQPKPGMTGARRGRRWFEISLARLLAISFGLLVALAVCGVLFLTVTANIRNTVSLLNLRAVETVESLVALIDSRMSPAADTVQTLAMLVESGALDVNDDVQLEQVLTGAISANPLVTALIVIDKDRTTRGVFREDGEIGAIDRSVVTNPQIMLALEQVDHEVSWGPMVFERGQVHANVGRSLVADGRDIGTLVAAVPIARISTLISEIAETSIGTPFILAGQHGVIAHPDMEAFRADNASTHPIVPLREFSDPVIQSFPKRQRGEAFRQAGRDGAEVAVVAVEDEEAIVVSTATNTYATRPWVVGLHFPEDVAAREFKRLIGSTVLGIVFLFVSVGVAIWLGRRLARPVSDLHAMAQQVTRLEFDNVRPMPPSRIREFDEAGIVLERMVDALRAFASYVPRSLVTKLVEMGPDNVARSMERDVTVMFTDIVGFTTLAEGMSAGETAEFLNEHFGILCEAVETTGGTVDKFLGDGMMAFWGAPDPMEDHAEQAARAATLIAQKLSAYNADREARGLAPVHLRVGIHSGPVVVGNIGPTDRVNYTIVGDTVNSCQRLEALGKVVAPQDPFVALMSDATAKAIGAIEAGPAHDWRIEMLSAFHVPGRAAPIEVYRLTA